MLRQLFSDALHTVFNAFSMEELREQRQKSALADAINFAAKMYGPRRQHPVTGKLMTLNDLNEQVPVRVRSRHIRGRDTFVEVKYAPYQTKNHYSGAALKAFEARRRAR